MDSKEIKHRWAFGLRSRAAIKLAMVDALDDLAELAITVERRDEYRAQSDAEVRAACDLLLEAERLEAA